MKQRAVDGAQVVVGVSPASNGGRGLKRAVASITRLRAAVSPASNGGRGLKLAAVALRLHDVCLARQ